MRVPRRNCSSSTTNQEAVGPQEAAARLAAAAKASEAATSSSVVASTDDSQSPPRAEPTIEDLDLSIPQVDCRFLADLVRCRRKRKEEFDDKRGAVLEKVEDKMSSKGVEMTAAEELAVIESLNPADQALATHYRPEYDDGFVLIDTRTVGELAAWGAIEGSKVLPAHELWDAFHMTPEAFDDAYGFRKPHPDDTIVFICQYGARSLMAAQILTWMGYPKVLHFRDGFYEWSKQYNYLLRRVMELDVSNGNDLKRRATFEAARQLQRDIAPEFNALPIQEAEKYKIDETRSMGTKRVGEGVREAAMKVLEEQKALLLGGAPGGPQGFLPSELIEPAEGGINDLFRQSAEDAKKNPMGVLEMASEINTPTAF